MYELLTLNIYYTDKIMNYIKQVNSDIYNNKWQKLIDSLLQVDYTKRFDINQVIKFLEDEINIKNNNKDIIKIPKFNGGFNGIDLKIIVIGNNGTNKAQYIKGTTKDSYTASIVSEFGFKTLEYEGNLYRIQLWDLAGEDKNTSISKIFLKDSKGVIIMSSATNIQSRIDCIKWKKSVDEIVIYPDGKELPSILVENNIDLLPNNELVDPTFEDFWKKNGFNKGFRVSSKTGENVIESVNYLVYEIIERIKIINENIKTGEINDIYFKEEDKSSLINKKKDKNCIIL